MALSFQSSCLSFMFSKALCWDCSSSNPDTCFGLSQHYILKCLLKGKNVWMSPDGQGRHAHQDDLFPMRCLVSLGSERNFLALCLSHPSQRTWTQPRRQDASCFLSEYQLMESCLQGQANALLLREWLLTLQGTRGQRGFIHWQTGEQGARAWSAEHREESGFFFPSVAKIL